ncbi:unnamed protein product, partial [Lymnaea stagnalis]
GSPSTPESPSTPGSPSTPESPSTPGSPSTPESPSTPGSPSTPESPSTPGSPSTPESPSTPGSPSTPESPSTPGSPSTPDTPESPSTPGSPSTPESPSTPGSPSTPESPSTPGSPSTPCQVIMLPVSLSNRILPTYSATTSGETPALYLLNPRDETVQGVTVDNFEAFILVPESKNIFSGDEVNEVVFSVTKDAGDVDAITQILTNLHNNHSGNHYVVHTDNNQTITIVSVIALERGELINTSKIGAIAYKQERLSDTTNFSDIIGPVLIMTNPQADVKVKVCEGTPSMPGSPGTPESPNTPELPSIPESPSTPGSPSTPESPSTPGSPSTPESPSSPGSPSTP